MFPLTYRIPMVAIFTKATLSLSAFALCLSLCMLAGHSGRAARVQPSANIRGANILYDVEGARRVILILNAMFPSSSSSARDARRFSKTQDVLQERIRLTGGAWRAFTALLINRQDAGMAVGLTALRDEFAMSIEITDLSSEASVRRIKSLLGTDWMRVRHDRPLDYLLTTRSAMRIPWAKSFEPESTRNQTFHGFDGDTVVPFMRGVRLCEFSRTSAGTLVDIPLQGNFALRIFEPLQGISLGENSLQWPNLVARRPSASLRTAVYIQLPRFHIVETGRSILAAIPLLHEVGVLTIYCSPQALMLPKAAWPLQVVLLPITPKK